MKWHYLILPVIGAVIGWITNYIAIKMLFRPYRPVRILGFTFQGLLPKRRKEFAASIARTVERDLLTVEDITRFFEGVEWEEEVDLAVAQTFEARMKSRTLGRILKTPILGLIGSEILRQIQKSLTHKIIAKIEEQKGRLVEKFQNAIELKEVVSRKVEGFNMEKIESLLMDLISQELTYIEFVGAVLGFIIGFVQMIILIVL
ncbi:MAG: DUF445 domain-containing protein [Nitrospirae bacterium CG_4_9_14_3_um_filter_53_35]|nr:MAG: hypothetical protein AUK29_03725 [Nitrospirae bacterium CG2_30_53_67]PIS38519.1 MAG: DUF445 domain-containing protein [Nitrospirae bacterium CG08_land_8_20_14_0_20_52_24]PIV82287.1 MAG: DUF445 domain-containing protein [Nitrospirae bacterium CG17_big_fil_post_rev_8_21_14_2_50_50_9]PIW86283.1 MAG: DUF445 domain-containing protein [Nitrospirae bacterium CG_4_8_14_3_um_filter_50_41]PIX86379.1 MAG: DUF445 domain-containing protein [Nitrospirae bacterium CG_4_10_14_3_um_filter_53_41]PJA7598